MLDGSASVRRLFPDVEWVGRDYPRRTGIFPIMHTIAIRRNSAAAQPAEAPEIYRAFVEVRRTDPYICCAGFRTLNTAPCGSVKTADRPTDGMSKGCTMTCPPPSAALAAVASASSTAK